MRDEWFNKGEGRAVANQRFQAHILLTINMLPFLLADHPGGCERADRLLAVPVDL